MQKLVFVVALAWFFSPMLAAQDAPLQLRTVQQFEKMLAAAHTKRDGEFARQLYVTELTERLSAEKLARWKAQMPGAKSREALTAVADRSEFLNLPSAEIPTAPAPDVAAQRKMMAQTVNYVSKTIHQLPNLLATRTTIAFQDQPLRADSFLLTVPQPFHSVGKDKGTIRYLDGKEVVQSGPFAQGVQGLTTSGEFGTIMVTVMVDAAQGKLAWSHWEAASSGIEAVYSFTIPAAKSHYELFCQCFQKKAGTRVGSPIFSPILYKRFYGYHGELAVDPSNGTILRLVVQADLKPTDPFVKAAIVVEYGPVELGGKTYICPIRSAAFSIQQMLCPNKEPKSHDLAVLRESGPLQTSVNDVDFAKYHLFAARARILGGQELNGKNP
jgi:hypothetical protein